MKIKLYMFSGSHSVRIAELMLEHKGITDYKRVNMFPGTHAFKMLLKGFETMAVPALKVDGRRIQGTRQISRALDELVPERPLFPADPDRRRAVEQAERWGEELQNASRRIVYCMFRRDRRAFASFTTPGRPWPSRMIVRAMAPAVIRLAGAAHRATEAAAQEDVATLPAQLDQIDTWIEEGLLDGAELNAADFQIGVCLSAMLRSDDAAPYLAGRPAERLALRVAPDYPGHIGPVLPAEWHAPLQAAAQRVEVPSGA
jgi:glutathione S-transferase